MDVVHVLDHSHKINFILITFLCISFLLGLIGNISIIGAICTTQTLQKPLNYFIINLSIADIILITLIGATSITGLSNRYHVFLNHPKFCNFVGSVCLIFCVVSLLTHMQISLTRYWAMRYGISFDMRFGKRLGIMICVITWLLATFISSFPYLGWGRFVYDMKAMVCIWDRTYSLGYSLYFGLLYVTLPVTTIFVSYLRLFLYIHEVGKKVRSAKTNDNLKSTSSTRRTSWNRDVKLARTLFAHFALVFLLWGQHAFIVIADYKNELPLIVHATSLQLAHSVAVFNIFIYLSNQTFRNGMIKFMGLREPLEKLFPQIAFTNATSVAHPNNTRVTDQISNSKI